MILNQHEIQSSIKKRGTKVQQCPYFMMSHFYPIGNLMGGLKMGYVPLLPQIVGLNRTSLKVIVLISKSH